MEEQPGPPWSQMRSGVWERGEVEVGVDDVAEGWWRKRRKRKMTVVDSISEGGLGYRRIVDLLLFGFAFQYNR
ncbi:hypothetical protein NC652_021421 [Populus alba x Populus x berolinensis]|nr:hypothetical protein NC652_021421 [Populus alba x Populus x berolinensis]